jgi:hypothetical protein
MNQTGDIADSAVSRIEQRKSKTHCSEAESCLKGALGTMIDQSKQQDRSPSDSDKKSEDQRTPEREPNDPLGTGCGFVAGEGV